MPLTWTACKAKREAKERQKVDAVLDQETRLGHPHRTSGEPDRLAMGRTFGSEDLWGMHLITMVSESYREEAIRYDPFHTVPQWWQRI